MTGRWIGMRSRQWSAAALTACMTLALAACSMLSPAASSGRACTSEHSAARCDAMLAWAAQSLGIPADQIVAVEIAPRTTEPPEMDRVHAVGLLVHLSDGSSRTATVRCPGVSGGFLPECMPDPHLVLTSATSNGYGDYPEGATPVPTVDPARAAGAVPLSVALVEVPITGAGPYRVKVGTAILANGVLQEASFDVGEAWPSTVLLRDGRVGLELVSLDGGKPFFNKYEHGWVDGLELVDVFIVFEAVIVRPGAHLVVTDLRVR